MENSQKLDAALRLSLNATEEERNKSSSLSAGYDFASKTWRVIVKYVGEPESLGQRIPGIHVIPLYNRFAIVRLRREQISDLAAQPEILYVEKPKEVYTTVDEARRVSCINRVQTVAFPGGGLTGRGVLVGIADSGVDFSHPAFRREDGTSRIRYYWDQTGNGTVSADYPSPEGYSGGIEWTARQLDQILNGELSSENLPEGVRIPQDRLTAHGTAVAGIAAGNGSGSAGRQYRGVATEAELIVVKLAPGTEGLSRTTEVMEALDYIVHKATLLSMPVSINISYGSNEGAHDGRSLFEEYITALSYVWKTAITVAAGNEGEAGHHARLSFTGNEEMLAVPFAIGAGERSLSLQLWKSYADDFAIFLEAPSGQKQLLQKQPDGTEALLLGNNRILILYGMPSPYHMRQEIYMAWLSESFLTEGIWRFLLIPERIVDGRVDLWLPTTEEIGTKTTFLQPDPETTLTIPSTAENIITVGAYRNENDRPAAFSGRGKTLDGRSLPILVAPGIDLMTTAPEGRYQMVSGTSFAAPFVAGSAALLMEWGIVRGNDPYLYGDKLKAYLIRGARRLPFQSGVPDTLAGWEPCALHKAFRSYDMDI